MAARSVNLSVQTQFQIMSDRNENEIVILHLEDNPMDRELVRKSLEAEDFDYRIVPCETRAEFEKLLVNEAYSLLLVDYQLPDFSGKDAMEMARARCPDVPFIFLSGVLGEEAAIESLHSGATDYVLKQRQERLLPAIRRALAEAAEHRQRQAAERAARRSEERFRVFMDNLPGLAFIKDAERRWVWLNRRWADILTASPETYIGSDRDDFLGDQAGAVREIEQRILESGMPADDTEEFGPTDDPTRQWLVTRFLIDQPDEAPMLGGVAFDITDRVRTERELAAEKNRLEQLVERNIAILAEHESRLA